MSGLNDLNTYGDIPITYTDLRTAVVKFDRTTSVDQTVPYKTNINFVLPAGINITGITLPDVEQVYFQVDVSAIYGATVSWSGLPSGYTVTNPSTGLYRISNIQSKTDWDIIKNAIIHPPTNYANSFNIVATIGYEGTRTQSWNTVAQITQSATMQMTSSLTASLTQGTVRATVRMSSAFTLPNTQALKGRQFAAKLTSTSTLQSVGKIIRLVNGSGRFSSASSIQVIGGVIKKTTATLSSSSTITTNNGYYTFVNLNTNLLPSRYDGNDFTKLFQVGPYYSNSFDIGNTQAMIGNGAAGAPPTYQVVVNLIGPGSLGDIECIGVSTTGRYNYYTLDLDGRRIDCTIQSSNNNRTLTYTATENVTTSSTLYNPAHSNSAFGLLAGIVNEHCMFYPVKDSTTSSINYSWTITRTQAATQYPLPNGVPATTYTRSGTNVLNYSGTMIASKTYTFAPSGGILEWIPTGSDLTYRSLMNYVVIGSGGKSLSEQGNSGYGYGGGGGGGNVVYKFNKPFVNQSYPIQVSDRTTYSGPTTFNGDSAANGVDASSTTPFNGGGNGIFSGGTGYTQTFSGTGYTGIVVLGGGGAGAGDNGGAASGATRLAGTGGIGLTTEFGTFGRGGHGGGVIRRLSGSGGSAPYNVSGPNYINTNAGDGGSDVIYNQFTNSYIQPKDGSAQYGGVIIKTF